MAVDPVLLALWQSGVFVVHVDVQVEKPLGSGTILQSLRDFQGLNWIKQVQVTPSGVDQNIGSGSATLFRQVGDVSLAPLMTASAANQDGGSYAPLLDFGREIVIKMCILPPGDEPVTADWDQFTFYGVTDDIEWPKKVGDVVVPFRDRSGVLSEVQILAERSYGDEDGVDAAVVLQAMLDDHMGAGQYTLDDLVSGDRFAVTNVTVKDGYLWEALQAVADQWGAAALRQRRNGNLGISDPSRVVGPALYTVTQSTYREVQNISTSGKNLRTIVRGQATELGVGRILTSQIPAPEDVESDPLVRKYGPRALPFVEPADTSAVDTQSELDAMVAGIYTDVSTSPIPLEMETKFCPFADVDDMVEWGANTLVFDEPQVAANLLLTHTAGPQPGTGGTTWKCADKPKSKYATWQQKDVAISGINAAPAETYYALSNLRFDETQETDTHWALIWDEAPGVEAAWGAALIFTGQPDDSKWRAVRTAVHPVTMPLMIEKPSAALNQVNLIQLESRYTDSRFRLATGSVWRKPVFPEAAQGPAVDVDYAENGETATAYWLEQDRGIPVIDRKVWTESPDATTGPVAPTRGPGATSVLYARTLLTGEYEHDATLSEYGSLKISPFLYLASTDDSGNPHVIAISIPVFDRNTVPNARSVAVDGLKILADFDSDTRSLTVVTRDLGPLDAGFFTQSVDGAVYSFTVPDPGTDRVTYRVYGYDVPKANVGVDSINDFRDVVVSGTTAPPAPAEWMTAYCTAASPSNGSTVAGLVLRATSAPVGSTVRVSTRTKALGVWGDSEDVTADLSPVPTAPPTVSTVYAHDVGPVRNDSHSRLHERQYIAEIVDSGVSVSTVTLNVQWYY